MNGFVKIDRDVVDNYCMGDVTLLGLYVKLFAMANVYDKECGGVMVQRGQLMTTLKELECKTGLTKHQLRNGIQKLQMWHLISNNRALKKRVITICNYDSYKGENNALPQDDGTLNASLWHLNAHDGGTIVALNEKERKQEKESNKEKEINKEKYIQELRTKNENGFKENKNQRFLQKKGLSFDGKLTLSESGEDFLNISENGIENYVEENNSWKNDNANILENVTLGAPKKFDEAAFKKALVENGADKAIVADFMLVRKKKKAVNTETALKAILNASKKVIAQNNGWDLTSMLRYCTERSWYGVQVSYFDGIKCPYEVQAEIQVTEQQATEPEEEETEIFIPEVDRNNKKAIWDMIHEYNYEPRIIEAYADDLNRLEAEEEAARAEMNR